MYQVYTNRIYLSTVTTGQNTFFFIWLGTVVQLSFLSKKFYTNLHRE